jgi:hypothetical protein
MILRTHRLVLPVLTAFTLLAAGCSSHVPLAGDVTFDGQPIDEGTITFVTPQGAKEETKSTCRIEGGKYKFEKDSGPAPGKYKVEITWLKKTGKKVPTGDLEPQDEKLQVLPAKFNTQTTLTAEVKSGVKKLDFALSSNQ